VTVFIGRRLNRVLALHVPGRFLNVEDESCGSGASRTRSIVAFLPTGGATVVATGANGLDSPAHLIKICVYRFCCAIPLIFFSSQRVILYLLRGRKPMTASWAEGQDNAHG